MKESVVRGFSTLLSQQLKLRRMETKVRTSRENMDRRKLMNTPWLSKPTQLLIQGQ
jgi:hypothetical protein